MTDVMDQNEAVVADEGHEWLELRAELADTSEFDGDESGVCVTHLMVNSKQRWPQEILRQFLFSAGRLRLRRDVSKDEALRILAAMTAAVVQSDWDDLMERGDHVT